jgi:hypothetical protein
MNLFYVSYVVRKRAIVDTTRKNEKGDTMAAMNFVRRFIFNLPEGETFTTRDCLNFGLRSAVDRALSRLVRSGIIRRLARGVFAFDPEGLRQYSDFEIAKLKAEAFGRKIAKHPSAIAGELKIDTEDARQQPQDQAIFSTDGHTSKFRVGDRTIHLKRSSTRKMRLANTKAGHAVRALWHLGKRAVSGETVIQALLNFNRLDRLDLKRSTRWIPSWLCDKFTHSRDWEPAHTI